MNPRGCQFSATERPIAAESAASSERDRRDRCPVAPSAAQFCTSLSQLMPEGAASIAPLVAFALLAGSVSHTHAITSHSAVHMILAPRTPSSPAGRPFGHTISPMSA